MVASLYALWSLLLYGERLDASASAFRTASNELLDYVFQWLQNIWGDVGVADLGTFTSSVTLNVPALVLAWITGLTFLFGLVKLIFKVFQLRRVF